MTYRIKSLLAALIAFALVGCGTLNSSIPTILESPAASVFVTATAGIPTGIPSPAAAAPVAPVPTDEIRELQDAALQKQIDQLAAWFLTQGKNPGLGIAVLVRDPHTGELEAMLLNYGKTGKGSQPVTSSTEYEIGSITKVFTGILLAQAVDSGAAQLNDPIQKYLPPGIQAPAYQGTPITLDDLATQRSGLPRDINTDSLPGLYGWLDTLQLTRRPGSEYVYSNVGYSLLSDLLARLAGNDFNTLEYEAVSRPLGLIDTREALDGDQADRLAQGHTYDGSTADYFPDSGAMSGAAYMHSTLADMTRFLMANMESGSTPLGSSIDLAQTLQAEGRDPGTGVGLGWEIAQLGTTGERLYKGGGTRGFTSYISFMRDRSYGFVILTNGMYVDNLVPHMLHILDADR